MIERMRKPDPEAVALVILDGVSLFAVLGFLAMVAMFAALASGQVPA